MTANHGPGRTSRFCFLAKSRISFGFSKPPRRGPVPSPQCRFGLQQRRARAVLTLSTTTCHYRDSFLSLQRNVHKITNRTVMIITVHFRHRPRVTTDRAPLFCNRLLSDTSFLFIFFSRANENINTLCLIDNGRAYRGPRGLNCPIQLFVDKLQKIYIFHTNRRVVDHRCCFCSPFLSGPSSAYNDRPRYILFLSRFTPIAFRSILWPERTRQR